MTAPPHRLPSTSQESKSENMMLEALKASKYPLERKIRILKTIIKGIGRDGKVRFEDVYDHLHALDESYQEDEIRDAFEFLSYPLLVIKQEENGRYVRAFSKNELNERLWLLSQVFLQASANSVLPANPE